MKKEQCYCCGDGSIKHAYCDDCLNGRCPKPQCRRQKHRWGYRWVKEASYVRN